MNPYLKMFILVSIFLGIMQGLNYQSLIFGLLWGLVSAITLILIYRFMFPQSYKRASNRTTKETISVHHQRNIVLNLPFDKAFELCLQSTKSIKYCRIKTVERTHGIIKARVSGFSIGIGDLITFKLNRINDNRTHIGISSKPVIANRINN